MPLAHTALLEISCHDSNVNLPFSECPYAWVEIRGSCYRFHPTKLSSLNANIFCATNNAYPVVLESELEAEELMNTVANISKYHLIS